MRLPMKLNTRGASLVTQWQLESHWFITTTVKPAQQ